MKAEACPSRLKAHRQRLPPAILQALLLAWTSTLALDGCGDSAKKHAAPAASLAICQTDSDCDAGRCDPFVGCAECLFDSDCASGSACVAEACRELSSCTSDTDCEHGTCDTSRGYCSECAHNSDCADAEQCAAGFCVKRRECDPACPADEVCSDGQCLPTCSKDSDCPEVYHCANGGCALDVCEAGRASCSSSMRALLRCSDAGDAFELTPCSAKQSCSAGEGDPACQAWLCVPGESTCDDAFQTARLCSADGLSFAQARDCSESNQVCDEGTCKDAACEPNTRKCKDGAIATCNVSGAVEQVTPCGSNERCDPKKVKCVAQACAPGEKGCLAETIATCSADGSGLVASGDDCAASNQACWAGECQPIVCSGDLSCVDGRSFQCSANRTQLALAEGCSADAGRFCNAETGKCQDFVCSPGLPTCNGDLATRCADDGSQVLDGGVDCAISGQVCWAAECATPICQADAYHCDGQKLEQCVHKGSAFEVVKTCEAGSVCDEVAGTCRLQKCTPDQPACDGNLATTCDGTGLSYVGQSSDCTQDGQVCVAGACKPIICEPNAVYCDGDELRECGANGGSYQLLDVCLASEFCDAPNRVCAPDVCAAGAPVCDSNHLTTCKSDGSGPAPGGTDCAADGKVCDRGACRALVCEPSARFCDGGAVALCNASGTDSAPYDTCRTREFCDETQPAAAACAPDICPQGGSGCQGEHLATCNLDGSDFSSVGVDCSAQNQVCDLSGNCAASALDDVGKSGAAVPSAGSAIHFGLFRMLTTRKLVSLDAAIVPELPGNITWIVYESSSLLGSYTMVDQLTASGTVSGGYLSSGAINDSLKADHYYLFGVAIKGPHDTSIEAGSSPTPVSFGQMLGGFTYVAGATPTIPTQLQVGVGLLQDDVALRVTSGRPL